MAEVNEEFVEGINVLKEYLAGGTLEGLKEQLKPKEPTPRSLDKELEKYGVENKYCKYALLGLNDYVTTHNPKIYTLIVEIGRLSLEAKKFEKKEGIYELHLNNVKNAVPKVVRPIAIKYYNLKVKKK